MFCSKCGKSIKDGSKFCQYCGNTLQNKFAEELPIIANFSLENHERVRRTRIQFESSVKKIVVIVVVIIAIAVICGYHRCDWCDKAFLGTAYYDSLEADTVMCEDCARQYYRGLDYTRFKIQ